MKKNEITLGQEFTVEFIKNKNGGKPICRIDGKIGVINSLVKSFVVPLSSWIVRIDQIHENFLVITPLVKTKSAKENIKASEIRLQKIKDRKQKVIRSFDDLCDK